MEKIRINKFLANAGVCSRRNADDHIFHGEVMINGKPAKLGDRINATTDKVLFRGKPISKNKVELEYWAVYKPVGYISTVKDENNRPTVINLVKSTARLYPVGRLDESSEGLMILTNDGEFTKILTHPSYEHPKNYTIFVKAVQSNSLNWIKHKFEGGVVISGRVMKAKEVLKISKLPNTGYIHIELVLTTGYNRQIRKMCDKMGLEVVKLIRTGIAKLRLSDVKLKPGQSKRVDKELLI